MEQIYLIVDECGQPLSYGTTKKEAMEIIKSILKESYESGQIDYKQYFGMLGELEHKERIGATIECPLYGIRVIERGTT